MTVPEAPLHRAHGAAAKTLKLPVKLLTKEAFKPFGQVYLGFLSLTATAYVNAQK